MNLKNLASKPKLIPVIMDDEAIVKKYGEPLEFYTWDRQPVNVFLNMATIDADNSAAIFEAVKDLVLDEDGKPIIQGEETLPMDVMMAVINQVVADLGK